MLNLLVILNDVLDLLDDALKRPFGQICRHLHVLLLTVKLGLLNFLHKVSHLDESSATAAKAIEHFLREISVNPVLLEDRDFLNVSGHFSHHARHKDRDLLLLEVAAQDLELGPGVALRHHHGAEQAGCETRKKMLSINFQ